MLSMDFLIFLIRLNIHLMHFYKDLMVHPLRELEVLIQGFLLQGVFLAQEVVILGDLALLHHYHRLQLLHHRQSHHFLHLQHHHFLYLQLQLHHFLHLHLQLQLHHFIHLHLQLYHFLHLQLHHFLRHHLYLQLL